MLYNGHTHTAYSHDSGARLADIANASAAAGLFGFAVTDHCDCEFAAAEPVYETVAASVRAARAFSAPGLAVHAGVELGDPLFAPAFARRLLNDIRFDVVLLSVHAVRAPKNDAPFSRIDFSGWTPAEARDYLRRYFDDLAESACAFDFDVLAHLTIPLRYLTHRFGFVFDPAAYAGQTDAVLRAVIARDKTLEVNTSGAGEGYLMPDATIIRRYLELGGTRFALGSDAHTPENAALGLKTAAGTLKAFGVTHATYYENRQPRTYPL